MANLYAFDIQPAHIYGIGIERDGKVCTVATCASIETTTETYDQGILYVCEKIGYTGGPVVVSLNPEFFTFAKLTLPFQDKKKIAQTLPFELDEQILGDIDSFVYDYLYSVDPKQPAHSLLTVGMIEKSVLSRLLDQFRKGGIDPNVISISGQNLAARIAQLERRKLAVLDRTATGITLFICTEGVIRTIRFFSFGGDGAQRRLATPDFLLWLKQTLFAENLVDVRHPDFAVVLINGNVSQKERDRLSSEFHGVPVEDVPAAALELLKFSPNVRQNYKPGTMTRLLGFCGQREKIGEFNFRTQDFRKTWSFATYRKYAAYVGVPVCVLLIGFIALFARDYSRQVAERDRLQEQTIALFKETMPEVSRIVNPLQQLQIAVNEKKAVYRPSGSTNQFNVLNILTELSARITPDYKVKFTRMVADVDNIRTRGLTKDFNTVDTIQKLLEKSPLFASATITSANQSLQENEVRFELKLDFSQ